MDKRWFKLENSVLAVIIIISLLLYIFRVHPIGYGNTYYAAAVKSMLTSLHNFFFVSFDPGGFVSVDKPPLGLWIQALSALIFGFKGWSILLPQAIASIISIILLYGMVRKTFGPVAGLCSAFIMAITPIFLAVSRTNELEPILIMILLFAAWAINIAAENGSLRWLILAMVLVGLGFNTKMFEAYLILPAFFVIYLLSPSLKMDRKIANLIFATVLLLAISFSWALIVDLSSSKSRPYVGGSKQNSVLSLAFDYSSIKHLLPGKEKQNLHRLALKEGGKPGVFRFFNKKIAGQISWLLPLASLGMIIPLFNLQKKGSREKNLIKQAIIFWGLWVITMLIIFSVTDLFQRSYLSLLAPGIAALTGIGMTQLWQIYNEDRVLNCLLPASILLNALFQIYILYRYPLWSIELIFLIFGLCALAAGVLLEENERHSLKDLLPKVESSKNINLRKPCVLTIIGFAGLLIAPFTWSLTPVLYGDQMVKTFAGPGLKFKHVETYYSKMKLNKLINFLVSHKKSAKYLVAVHSATLAAPLILETGKPVMTMGGYAGKDHILTVKSLKNLVNAGKIRYFLILQTPSKKANPAMWRLDNWIIKNGIQLPESLWRGDFRGTNKIDNMQLYCLRNY